MSESTRSKWPALAARWLGIGLATVISVVTLGLGVTGRLTLYISPESVWFACAAAVVTLAGALWSCTLPLGAEEDHGHDHGHAGAESTDAAADAASHPTASPRRRLAAVGTATAGVVATGVVAAALVLPPASLSVELAMSRAGEQNALFAGADTVTLGVADTTAFGIGDWSSVFATATNTSAYDGAPVTLTGFVTPAGSGDGAVNLTRLVITHCVIDAQPAAVPVSADKDDFATGQWVEVTGTVRADDDGALHIEPTSVVEIDEPGDPYEY